jgi:single-stranded DNA-specific DHH superfamily exonuclease
VENLIEILKEIRQTARKMHESYLMKHGLLDEINKLVPNDYKIKEKIDIIILGEYKKCACGNLAKPQSNWCSVPCKNRDPDVRQNISIKNSENKETRSKKNKETLFGRYGVTAVQDIPEVKKKTKEKNSENYKKWIEETFEKYELDMIQYSDFTFLDEICKKSSYYTLSEEHFNGMPPMTIFRHFERIGFDPDFKKNGSSVGELQMGDFIENLGFVVIRRDRKTISPYEILISLIKI